MTDLERAFLADIAAHPQDDFPRLAYADWLEEHGQSERAEFIRVQCAIPLAEEEAKGMHIGAALHRACELRRREKELLTTPSPGCPRCVRWAPEIILVATGWRAGRTNSSAWEFHRGFISSITLPCDAFLEHAADIIEAVPMLEEVRWPDAQPWSFAPENPERSAWWYGLRRNSPHDVPDAIWKHLRGKKTFIMGYVWVCVYDAEDGSLADELAHVDLSQACLTFAREQLAARRNFRPGIVAATAH